MKIGILNLPFDNNYGGSLQRYALVAVLQRMGYQVEHINLQLSHKIPWQKRPFVYAKRLVKKMLFCSSTPIFLERQLRKQKAEKNRLAEKFYEKYIPHTPIVHTVSDIKKTCSGRYAVYVVGSDQVWREGMTRYIGLEIYFLKFTRGEDVRRIAYSVSTGNNECYNQKLVCKLSSLYKLFDAVSVREETLLPVLESYGWNNPVPVWTLDPTLLLSVNDYRLLIDRADGVTDITSGRIYCYILDDNEKVSEVIRQKEKELGVESVVVGLADTADVSIEQWLNNISKSRFVITDSYHGTVFSILFNKPFLYVGNCRRGNSRIDSLFEMLDISAGETDFNWSAINENILKWRRLSLSFLKEAIG